MTVFLSLVEAFNARGTKVAGREGRMMVAKHLSSVGLREEVLIKFPRELSGGEQQRVALARALVVEPRLLILDEPTSGIDALTQSSILALIKHFNTSRGVSILYITHDVPVAVSLCSALAVLNHGTVVEQGSREELLRDQKDEYTRRLMRDAGVIPGG